MWRLLFPLLLISSIAGATIAIHPPKYWILYIYIPNGDNVTVVTAKNFYAYETCLTVEKDLARMLQAKGITEFYYKCKQ